LAQLTARVERDNTICWSRLVVDQGGKVPIENHESPCPRYFLVNGAVSYRPDSPFPLSCDGLIEMTLMSGIASLSG
jgi:hypothetical protein